MGFFSEVEAAKGRIKLLTLTSEGKLHIVESPGILAGSAQMLITGVKHLVHSIWRNY